MAFFYLNSDSFWIISILLIFTILMSYNVVLSGSYKSKYNIDNVKIAYYKFN